MEEVADEGTRLWGQIPAHPSSLLSLQLPWKSLASIVQFYYMWKTTDRYIQQVRSGLGRLDQRPSAHLCL